MTGTTNSGRCMYWEAGWKDLETGWTLSRWNDGTALNECLFFPFIFFFLHVMYERPYAYA